MNILSQLLNLNELADLSELPDAVMKKIQGNIRKGAADTTQQWANALELTQRAYKVTGVQRPDPSMRSAWTQYEKNITYSVEQLAKTRGLSGGWRLSSALMSEAANPKPLFQINLGDRITYTRADNIKQIIKQIKDRFEPLDDVAVDIVKGVATITFSNWGIQNNKKIIISPAFNS